MNIGLIILTIAGWSTLVWRTLGKRVAAISGLALSAFLFASPSLATGLLGNTIRNIEYPIFLGYVASVACLLHTQKLWSSRKLTVTIACFAILMAFVMAGDGLMLFLTVLSVLATIIWQKLRWRSLPSSWKPPLMYIGLTVLGYAVIKYLAQKVGIVSYYNDVAFQPRVISYDHLGISISETIKQLIEMHGATVFGLNPIGRVHLLYFLNALLLICGIWGTLWILNNKEHSNPRQAHATQLHFKPIQYTLLTCLSFSFIVILALYVIADQVVQNGPHGTPIPAGQARYLTLLPFLSSLGLAVWLSRFRLISYRYITALACVIVMGFLASGRYLAILHSNAGYGENYYRSTTARIAQTAEANDIHTLVTGYWYGATVRFWSQNRIQYANVMDCNLPGPTFNMRWSWYKPSSSVKRSALIVDRTGNDAGSWKCSNQDLIRIYGQPEKVISIPISPDPVGEPVKTELGQVQMWIYGYDLRQKISLPTSSLRS